MDNSTLDFRNSKALQHARDFLKDFRNSKVLQHSSDFLNYSVNMVKNNIWKTLFIAGVGLKVYGGEIDQALATRGYDPSKPDTEVKIKADGKPTSEYIDYMNYSIFPELDQYEDLDLDGPDLDIEPDYENHNYTDAHTQSIIMQRIFSQTNNTDSLPTGIENIESLRNRQAVCLAVAKQALQEKYGYDSRSPEFINDFINKGGMGSWNAPIYLKRLGGVPYANPIQSCIEGKGDMMFAVFTGSLHIQDGIRTGHRGTHTMIPIGYKEQTFDLSELGVQASSSEDEIIAAYCLKYPTFVYRVNGGGSSWIENRKQTEIRAAQLLSDYKDIITISINGNTVTIKGPYLQHGDTVKGGGTWANVKHTEPLVTFMARTRASGEPFFTPTELWDIPDKHKNYNKNNVNIPEENIIGGRWFKNNDNLTLSSKIDQLLLNETDRFPDEEYPSLSTRKKWLLSAYAYMGLGNNQNTYRLYPQLSTSKEKEYWYEQIKNKIEESKENYDKDLFTGSALDNINSLPELTKKYKSINIQCNSGRSIEQNIREIMKKFGVRVVKREPNLSPAIEYGADMDEMYKYNIIAERISQGVLILPDKGNNLIAGKKVSINISAYLTWLKTQAEYKSILHANHLLINSDVNDFYKEVIPELFPDPSTQGILLKVLERESPGASRDFGSLRKLAKTLAERGEDTIGENKLPSRLSVNTEGQTQTNADIFSEISQENLLIWQKVAGGLRSHKLQAIMQAQGAGDPPKRIDDLDKNLILFAQHIKALDTKNPQAKKKISKFQKEVRRPFLKKIFNLGYAKITNNQKRNTVTELYYTGLRLPIEGKKYLDQFDSKGKIYRHTYGDGRKTGFLADAFVVNEHGKGDPQSMKGFQETIVHLHNSGFPKMAYYQYSTFIFRVIAKAQESDSTKVLTNEQRKEICKPINCKDELKTASKQLKLVCGYILDNEDFYKDKKNNSKGSERQSLATHIQACIADMCGEKLNDKNIRDESVGLVDKLTFKFNSKSTFELQKRLKSKNYDDSLMPTTNDIYCNNVYFLRHFWGYNAKTYPKLVCESLGMGIMSISGIIFLLGLLKGRRKKQGSGNTKKKVVKQKKKRNKNVGSQNARPTNRREVLNR